MKKATAIGIALLLLLTMSSGCGITENANNTETKYEITAIALNENGGTLLFYLLNGVNSGLVSIYTTNAELTASDGATIGKNDFETGQLVAITYDGTIAVSYPGQILSCYGIRIIGEADKNEISEALSEYQDLHTVERTIYYVDTSGILTGKTIPVIYGGFFGEWKKANNVPEEVRLLELISEDNAYTETVGEVVHHTLATVLDFHLDLSEEFLTYLLSAADEKIVVSALVKTMIGDNPFPEDTGVYITVNGSPLITRINDFSERLVFNT